MSGLPDKPSLGTYADPHEQSAIRALSDRLNDMEKKVLHLTDIDTHPHEQATTDAPTSYQLKETQLKEIHSRIEKEEKTRALLEQRMVKCIDAALVPIQSAIQDEANIRQTHLTNIQSTVRVLRSDMENEIPNRLKQMDGLKRQVAQTKDEVGKEVEERILAVEQLTSSLQDLQKTVERLKQDRTTSEEMIRRLVSDEGRARTSQLSMLQDCYNGMKQDTEAELKIVKQMVDARVRQRRQGDDELIHRMDEYALSNQQEQNNREALEASVKKELAEVKQQQKNEKTDASNFIQVGLQTLDNQIKNRLTIMEVNFTKEIGQSKSLCEGVEKRLSVLYEEMMRLKDRLPGFDMEALRASLEKAIEKEARDRTSSEEALKQQVEHLSVLVEPRAPELASMLDRHSVTKQEERPKPERPDFDLMTEIRSISMNHLEGNMRIWGGKDDYNMPAYSAQLSKPGSLLSQTSATPPEKHATQLEKQPEKRDPPTFTSWRASSTDRFGLTTAHTP